MQVLVLGVGNILLQDEGVGVRVVQEFQRRFQLPAGVDVLDGGTAGMCLIEDILDKDHVIIVDAVQTGQPPGTLVRLTGDEVPVFLQQRISPHQLGLSEVLATLALIDKKPQHLVLIGIVPKSMELSLELSAEIEHQVNVLIDKVVAELAAIGVRPVLLSVASA
jgi:hydrogenase maturation protease